MVLESKPLWVIHLLLVVGIIWKQLNINKAKRETLLSIRFVENTEHDVNVLSIAHMEFDMYLRKPK